MKSELSQMPLAPLDDHKMPHFYDLSAQTPIKSKKRASLRQILGLIVLLGASWASIPQAQALQVDWSGQFWSEFNFIQNYTMDSSPQGALPDNARLNQGGYYIPGSGRQDASFLSLFMRVRPKVIVNDNIYIKSEWWLGDPVFGIYGSAVPYTVDQRQYYSFQSRGVPISAQRLWGEFLTDLGTVQIGRVPLDWGLGVVWNQGEDLWSRYMSTGDAIRWVAKFGSFTFIPSVIINSAGNNIAGSCVITGTGTSSVCTPGTSDGGVTDYSVVFKYESVEDEIEGGINIIRRLGGTNQDPNGGLLTPPQPAQPVAAGTNPNTGAMNFTVFDFFAKKQFHRFSLAGEVPLVTGSLGGSQYQSFAVAAEAKWDTTDSLSFLLKTGYAPGQTNETGTSIGTYRAFFFNPNYHVGMILFNYQLANFSGAQTLNNPNTGVTTLKSPYDNPIVDAAYVALSSEIQASDKWTIRPAFVYAVAPTTAQAGQSYFNYWTRTLQPNAPVDQGSALGWEVDLGVKFKWDEHFQVNLDTGVFVPGSFYAFSGVAGTTNATSPVFAASARVGVSF